MKICCYNPRKTSIAFATLMLFAGSAAWAQSNLVGLISAVGDYIGGGQTYSSTNQADIAISGSAATISVLALGFTMVFDGPGQANLAVGRYPSAVRYPLNGGSPGLSVSGNGRSCTNVCGSFEILELETNGVGEIVRFWGTFLQHCECGSTAPFTGEIRYNSLLAPDGPLPRVLRVPTDFASIQAAINNASTSVVETVLVGPGFYVESVQLGSKGARLVSSDGPTATFITAPVGAAAVGLGASSKKGTAEVLVCGFTLADSAIGVDVAGGFSPVIASNRIVNCSTGIRCNGNTVDYRGSPTIRGNAITGGLYEAVKLWFTEAALVEANRLEGNGSGVTTWGAGWPTIRNNLIRNNREDGCNIGTETDANVIQNMILQNTGDGIQAFVQTGTRGPNIINNTIAGNAGAGIVTDGYEANSRIVNNIIVGNPGIRTLNFGSFDVPIIEYNNIYSRTGAAYAGTITNHTGFAGNISTDPFFACEPEGNFHLLSGSPCIDTGINDVPSLTGTDLDGLERIVSGAPPGPAILDLGAYEFDPSNAPTACLFLVCPFHIEVIAAPDQGATVNYQAPYATPGATVTCSHASGSVFPAGDTFVDVVMAHGTNTLSCGFTISVVTTNDLGGGLGARNLQWSTSGDAPWFVQRGVAYDGMAAAQSGPITNNQTSVLQANFDGPGRLDFWWKVVSQSGRDVLSLKLDGNLVASIDGFVDWRSRTYYLGAGPHVMQWVYAKDASGSASPDAGWVDQVTYTPGPTPPIIVSQPASLSVARGLAATFSTAVVGTPPLAFQWQHNGTNLPGATNSSLVITNVQSLNVGIYSVAVGNAAGMTNSAAATLNLAQVVAWGNHLFGATNVSLSLTNALAVGGGYRHSAALKADGTVIAWGATNAGQTKVPQGLSNVMAIASRSGDFAMALKSNGTVAVWGDNSTGQTNIPVGLSNVVSISVGGGHCLALKADGQVAAWGYIPTVPAGLSNVVAVSAGDLGSLALKSDGTVVGWGQPLPPSGLSNIVAIALGYEQGYALKSDGTVIAWGRNNTGQTNVPPGLSNVVAISAGDNHGYALKADGTIAVWGMYYLSSLIPAVSIAGLSNVVAIAAGSHHDLALLGDGPPTNQATVTQFDWKGNEFRLKLPTESGRTYRLEYRDSLEEGGWMALPLVPGNGFEQEFKDTSAVASQRFYRVRRW